MLHSRNRPRQAVHQPHQAGLCSSMAGWHHTHHHHPALAAYGVQDWRYTFRTIAAGAEDRSCVGDALQGAGRVPVKLRMSSGRGKDAQSVPAKALRYRLHPVWQSYITLG